MRIWLRLTFACAMLGLAGTASAYDFGVLDRMLAPTQRAMSVPGDAALLRAGEACALPAKGDGGSATTGGRIQLADVCPNGGVCNEPTPACWNNPVRGWFCCSRGHVGCSLPNRSWCCPSSQGCNC
jgi:hypothetical protein